MQKIFTSDAPAPVGPYNQAIKSNGFLYISGQLGIEPASGKLIADKLEEQTHQCMQNIESILKSEGLSTGNLIKTTILIRDIGKFKIVNEIYGSYLREPFPARATYEVSALPLGGLIEIEAVAEY